MKKGLLLSVIASTMIFAGGDIAPVQPEVVAPASDCSDFYGSVGAYYQTVDGDVNEELISGSLFDADNSKFSVTAVIGVEKNLFGGIGFGAEVAGWSRITNDIATRDRVGSTAGTDKDGGELTQLYLTAAFGNTAFKAGRFAIPGSLSPFARTGTTAGVKDTTYEGLMFANTDLADTTIYGLWAYRSGNGGTFNKLGEIGSESGAFSLGFQNKSIANTTLTAVGYYGPGFGDNLGGAVQADGTAADAYSVWGMANTKIANYTVDAQVGYVSGNVDLAGVDAEDTIVAGAKVAGKFDMFDAYVAASYRNGGFYPAALSGTGSLIGDAVDHGFEAESFAVGTQISAEIGPGKAYGRLSYISYEDTLLVIDATVSNLVAGYKFKLADIDFKAEYKYSTAEATDAMYNITADTSSARVRLEAAYKF